MTDDFPTFDRDDDFSEVEVTEVFIPKSHGTPFRKTAYDGRYNATRVPGGPRAYFHDSRAVMRRTSHTSRGRTAVLFVVVLLLSVAATVVFLLLR